MIYLLGITISVVIVALAGIGNELKKINNTLQNIHDHFDEICRNGISK